MAAIRRALLLIGSALLLVGTVAGVGNREVLDGSRFAAHADAIRTDPDVSRQVGILVTDRVIKIDPDLAIARPLVESTSSALVGSDAFGPAVRAMVIPVHRALTTDGSDSVALRLADVGAVLIAALSTVAPDAVASLPPDLDVTLAKVGENDFSSSTIAQAHLVKQLSWLLPLLALLCFAGFVLLSRDRARALRSVGLAAVSTGLVLGVAVFTGNVVAARVEPDSLSAAVGVAAWHELTPALWTAAALLLAAGYVLALGSVLRLGVDPRTYVERAVRWVVQPPSTRSHRLARALVLLGVGTAAVLSPLTTVAILASVAGFMLAITGVTELAKAARRPPRIDALPPLLIRRPEIRTALVAAVGFALVAALVLWNARPPQQAVAAIGSSDTTLCNGHAELCDRTYDEVAYAATHNSMSAADEPRWFLAEQPTGLIGQLDDGIHVLLIDTWPGQKTRRAGVVANAESTRAEATAQAVQTYGKSLVASALRLRDATNLTPSGPVRPYLCHALCELGSTPLEPALAGVRAWMQAHPREVITLFIQDEVSPADTARAFKDAGLLSMVHTQAPGRPWPTLGEMIDTGRRLVVLAENKGGGAAYPWLLQGFDVVQDTPYDAKRVADFSCDRLRGPADAPLLLINHWLNRPQHRVSDSAKVNAASVLGPRLDTCQKQRHHLPNFVAVDYYDHGALLTEVDRLNGVG